MAYFAPYIDDTGLHMPTYEDRVSCLCEAYKSIFGIDSDLPTDSPDYQYICMLAQALMDSAKLVEDLYAVRNPLRASNNALDLLGAQLGAKRIYSNSSMETDDDFRRRMTYTLAGRGVCSYDALRDGLRSVMNVKDAAVYVNDTDITDSIGIPSHSIAAVLNGGGAANIANTLFDKVPPGIGMYGTTHSVVYDSEGTMHTVSFSRCSRVYVFLYLWVYLTDSSKEEEVVKYIKDNVFAFVNSLKIAEPLNIAQLFGVAYGSNRELSNYFLVSDIQGARPSAAIARQDIVAAWNELIAVIYNEGISVNILTPTW